MLHHTRTGGRAVRGLALFPLAFLFLASPLFAQVEVEFDEASDVTTVSFPAVGSGGDAFALTASFECLGDRLCVPSAVQMVFSTWNRRPKYRTNHDVTLVLDKDAEVSDVRTRYMEQSEPGVYRGVLEIIVCDTETQLFSRIAAADRVDYRIGSTKGKLSKDQRAALAALAEKIEKVETAAGS